MPAFLKNKWLWIGLALIVVIVVGLVGFALGFFYGALDRLHGGFDIHHHALLQTA